MIFIDGLFLFDIMTTLILILGLQKLKTTITIIAVLFSYIAFATFFYEMPFVGAFGQAIGGMNFQLFGNFAYINIFILFYMLHYY